METVLRIVAIYLMVLLGIRIMGKREFSQLSPFELVTLLLVPELVQQAAVREDFSLTNAVVAVSTLFTLVFLTSVVTHRSARAARVVASEPTVLASHGRLVPRNMDLERVSADEIFAEMRKAGLERLAQVRWAILESDGRISIVPAETSGTPGEAASRSPTIG